MNCPDTPTPPWPSRLKRILRRWAIIIAVLLVVVSIAGCALQDKFIFPGSWMTQGAPDAMVHPDPGTELVKLRTSTGNTTYLLFGSALTAAGRPHPKPQTRATLLYFYGNAMHLAAAQPQMDDFRRLGVNVAMVEYIGYGMADGKPSEQGCYVTADAAYDYLLNRTGIDPKKIVPIGWSLGAAVACDLASRRPAAGLVMCSPFTSMDAVARHHYWFLPVSLILSHHFRSIDKIAQVAGPILIIHGTNDPIVPYSMSLELQTAAGQAGKSSNHLPIRGAEHNDLFTTGDTLVFPAIKQLADRVAAIP